MSRLQHPTIVLPQFLTRCLLVCILGGLIGTFPASGQEEWESVRRMEELRKRVEMTESAVVALQAQNEALRQQLETLPQPSEEKKEEKKPDKDQKAEKKWYDKVGLRGYAQFRYNYPTHLAEGSAPPNHAGDSSIAPDQEFLIRRARLIFFGDVNDHLYLYMQPDFASTPNGAVDRIEFAQIRDWYGDIYVDTTKVHRFRVGQSKVPYGWENLQSSRDRLPLDRHDAFNSTTKNERDLGVFYYWTPEWAQDTFKYISDNHLKGSGNYGVFGVGVHNGQGGSLQEFNDGLHVASRLTLPLQLANCQIIEFGVQGYTGQYVVLGASISPLGVGPAAIPLGTRTRGGEEGLVDHRIGWTFVYYPQPLGFQAEYTWGQGPELNAAQTAVERGSLDGGYAMLFYRHQSVRHGELWPFARWQYFKGGYKSAPNAPSSLINEWSVGLEWQIMEQIEFTCEYLITDRTSLQAFSSGRSYEQYEGQVARFQLQLAF
ncbi:MAG: porin [Planctomycetes bacterium]|nr:porin [Planctomycetota bacterium]